MTLPRLRTSRRQRQPIANLRAAVVFELAWAARLRRAAADPTRPDWLQDAHKRGAREKLAEARRYRRGLPIA
jgi:hypothetical protein